MASTDIIQKDLGLVTAYGYALAGGYQGTEEQFKQDFAALMNGHYKADVEIKDISSYLNSRSFIEDEYCIMHRYGRLTILHYYCEYSDARFIRSQGTKGAYILQAQFANAYRNDKLKPIAYDIETSMTNHHPYDVGEAKMTILDTEDDNLYSVPCDSIYYHYPYSYTFAIMPLLGLDYVPDRYKVVDLNMRVSFINSYTGEEESDTEDEP